MGAGFFIIFFMVGTVCSCYYRAGNIHLVNKKDFVSTVSRGLVMASKLHFMVTSVHGRTRAFSVKKTRLKVVGVVAAGLMMASAVGWYAAVENVTLRVKSAAAKQELAQLQEKHHQLLASAADREEKQRAKIDAALQELKQRGEAIESILSAVDIDIDVQVDDELKNTGGPFIGLEDDSYGELTFKIDHYLNFLESMPLGTPVKGTLTSPFGRRYDPFTGNPAMHDGLDIRNHPGTEITSPAPGKVTISSYTRFNGHYVVIDHGNGFKTRYLHMRERLVKRGDEVERGQVIGELGNTGRSTGPHLHYTILYKGEPIDPYRFVRVAAVLDGTVSASGRSVRGQKVQ